MNKLIENLREFKTEHELPNDNTTEYNVGYVKAINDVLNVLKNNIVQANVISSGTKPKCDKCADMYWIYEDNGTRRGCECHYL